MKATTYGTVVLCRRLVAVLGATALLASAGCGNEYVTGTPAGEAPSLEMTATEESEPETGFDECSLIDPSEAAEWMGIDALYVTGRSAMRLDDGSMRATCTYFPENVPGMLGMHLNTVTDTDPERFFAPFKKYDNVLSVEEIGDRTEAVGYSARGTSTRFLEIRTIAGDRGIHLYYTYSDGGVMPELNGGAAVGTIMRGALERLPDEVTIPDGTPEGVCADLHLELAAEALGAELGMARSVVAEGDAVSCFFSGDGTNLDYAVLTDPKRAKGLAVARGDVTHSDIGDGARLLITEAGSLDARINLGDHVVAITASYGDDAGAITEPRPEDIALVQTIVDSVGE